MISRIYIEIAAIVLIIVGVLWYRAHLINAGEQIRANADMAVVLSQRIHKTEVETRAKDIADQQTAQLRAELAAAPSLQSPTVLVCDSTTSPGPVRPHASPRPSAHEPPSQPAVVGTERLDIGPLVDKRLQDADSIIGALQAYIRDCQEAGVCAK